MEITIKHGTEIIDGKGYPFTFTRITGLQQVQRHGRTVWVTAVTYHDGPLGCQPCYRLYEGPIPPTGEVENRLSTSVEARVKEIAAQGMMRKGEIA